MNTKNEISEKLTPTRPNLQKETYEAYEAKQSQFAADCNDFMEYFGYPDYDYWGRMEYWDREEALLLSLGVKPVEEALDSEELREILFRANKRPFTGEYTIYDFYRAFFREFFSRQENIRLELMGRAELEKDGKINSLAFVQWCERMRLDLPAELVKAVRKYHGEETESVVEPKTDEVIPEPLSPGERRELGMLQQQKEKWEKSIEATVEAVMVAEKKKKITRDELNDHLHAFDLPAATLEVIWRALRKKGLTKGPGRPKSEKEKNP